MKWLFALTVLFGHLAEAKCGTPEAYTLPRPGSELPPNPTLFFFVPPEGQHGVVMPTGAVSENGQSLPFKIRQLEGGGELQVFQISITAADGVSFHLEPRGPPRGKVPTTPPWTVKALEVNTVKQGAASPTHFVLSRGKDVAESWTCSYESLRVLDSTLAAPAYRVEFAQTEEELLGGKGKSVVVEGRNDGWRRMILASNGRDDPPAPAVRLGHHDCWGSNLLWKTPKLAVRVTALLADGTEQTEATIFTLDAPADWDEISKARRGKKN